MQKDVLNKGEAERQRQKGQDEGEQEKTQHLKSPIFLFWFSPDIKSAN